MRRIGLGRIFRRRAPLTAPVPEGIVIGDLRGPTAVVDPKGTVHALDGSWRLEWGVGADDRWRVAHEEVAVRQQRVDDAPVLATAMRVPGGDLVHRVAAVSDGEGRAVVIELDNESGGAVAAAVVIRGAGPAVAGAEGAELAGRVLRPEGPVGGAAALADDPWAAVRAEPPPTQVSADAGPDGGAALVVAVPHRQRTQMTLVVDGPPPGRSFAPAEVAAGWRAVTAKAASIDVPDTSLAEAWRRVVPDLVVAAGSDDPLLAAQAAWFLDVVGLFDEADRARAMIVARAERGELQGLDAAAALLALSSREIRADRESGLADLAGPLVHAAGDALTSPVLEVIAHALEDRAPAAAADARMLSVEYGPGWWTPHAPVVRAAGEIVASVVDEDMPTGLSLLARVPTTWFGGEVDVRGVHTMSGEFSFSVRWHGARPALLWERAGGPEGVLITVPGLDPDWESRNRTGEALLHPAVVP